MLWEDVWAFGWCCHWISSWNLWRTGLSSTGWVSETYKEWGGEDICCVGWTKGVFVLKTGQLREGARRSFAYLISPNPLILEYMAWWKLITIIKVNFKLWTMMDTKHSCRNHWLIGQRSTIWYGLSFHRIHLNVGIYGIMKIHCYN